MHRQFPFPTEGIFYTMADQHYWQAMDAAGRVRRYSAPREYMAFHGFPTDEGLAFAIAALVGWATAIEASVNDLYNKHVNRAFPPLSSRQSRPQNTVHRFKKLLQSASVAPQEMSWWPDILDLFSLRQELVQLSLPSLTHTPLYDNIFRLKLTEQLLTNTRSAVSFALDKLGELFGISYSYLYRNHPDRLKMTKLAERPQRNPQLALDADEHEEDDIPY